MESEVETQIGFTRSGARGQTPNAAAQTAAQAAQRQYTMVNLRGRRILQSLVDHVQKFFSTRVNLQQERLGDLVEHIVTDPS
eukprot:3355112-Amphidinium_carterae.1